MDVMGPLGHRALVEFDELIEREAIECGYRRDGYFAVCRTDAGLDEARLEGRHASAQGFHVREVDGRQLRELEPSLAPGVVGAIHHEDGATLDPLRFLLELSDRAVRLGVIIEPGRNVVELVTAAGAIRGVRMADGSVEEADAVVLATGPYALELLRPLGLSIPVQPGKGYHRDVPVGAGGAPSLRIACVLVESSVFCTPMGPWVRFAGTMEFSGLDTTLRRGRLRQIERAARAAFPTLGDAVRSEWAGLRPVSADGLPVVGPVPGTRGLSVATGHGMLGLTFGPLTGRLLAERILIGSEAAAIPAWAPERFSRS